MGLTLFLSLLSLAAVAWLFEQGRRRKNLNRIKVGYRKVKRTTRIQPNAHPYCAVSIQSLAGACKSARQLGEQRFLSAEAPPLPLPGCTTKDCRCHYQFYDDRRAGDERRITHPQFAEDFSRSGTWRERQRKERRQENRLH